MEYATRGSPEAFAAWMEEEVETSRGLLARLDLLPD